MLANKDVSGKGKNDVRDSLRALLSFKTTAPGAEVAQTAALDERARVLPPGRAGSIPVRLRRL